MLIALNFHPRNTLSITPTLATGSARALSTRRAWHVRAATGGPITSRHVEVQTNATSWVTLAMEEDGGLPDIEPMIENPHKPTALPPQSYVIALMEDTGARACSTQAAG